MTIATHTARACPKCGADVLPAMARCRMCGSALHDASPGGQPTNGKHPGTFSPSDSGSAMDLDAMYQAAGIEQSPTPAQAVSSPEPPVSKESATRNARPHHVPDPTGDPGIACTRCGRAVHVPESLVGKRVKCPGCGTPLPVPGAPADEPESHEEPQREFDPDEVRHQLRTAVESAVRAAPPAPKEQTTPNESVSRSDLRRLKRSLARVSGGTQTLSQLEAAESAIENIGRIPDPRIGKLLRDQLDQMPQSLQLTALHVLAVRGNEAVFEPTIRMLPDADGHTLPVVLKICGELNDPRTLPAMLIIAARMPQQHAHAIDALSSLGARALSQLVSAAGATGSAGDEIRCAAIEVLERIADPRTAPRLSKLVKDVNPRVRLRVIKALSAIDSDSTLRPLVAGLSDADTKVRVAAAAALARRPHPRLAPHLAQALNDSNRDVRLHAVKGLGLCENPGVACELRPLLACGDEELELAAAESIARLGDEKIVPEMLDRLLREMQNPGSEPGAEKFVDALRRLRDDRAVLPLVEILRHPRDTMRARAAEALGQIGDSAAVDSLTELLQREFSAKVQSAAAKALGELRDPQAIPALEKALEHSSHVRCKALIALGEIGGKRALRSLIELTSDPAATVRYHAANSLAKTGDRQAISALEPLTLDSDEMVRRSAFKALQELGDDRSRTEIIANAKAVDEPATRPGQKPPRRAFTLQQLVPDVMLGLDSRQTAIYLGGVLGAVALIALVAWAGTNWNSDTVVVRGYVSTAAISGDGKSVAVVRTLGLFEVWDTTGQHTTYQSPNSTFSSLYFAPDGRSLLGISGNTPTLLQLNAERQVTHQTPFEPQGNAITVTGTSPHGTRVATASDTGKVVCWNIQNGSGEWSLQLPNGQLQELAVSETGERAAAVTNQGVLLIWNAQTGEVVGEYALSGRPPRILGLSFDDAGERLAAGTAAGDLYVWEFADLRKPQVIASDGRAVRLLRFVNAQKLLVLRGDSIETWNVQTEQSVSFKIDVELDGSVTAAASPDASRVVIGADESSSLYVFDVASGKLEFELRED